MYALGQATSSLVLSFPSIRQNLTILKLIPDCTLKDHLWDQQKAVSTVSV